MTKQKKEKKAQKQLPNTYYLPEKFNENDLWTIALQIANKIIDAINRQETTTGIMFGQEFQEIPDTTQHEEYENEELRCYNIVYDNFHKILPLIRIMVAYADLSVYQREKILRVYTKHQKRGMVSIDEHSTTVFFCLSFRLTITRLKLD